MKRLFLPVLLSLVFAATTQAASYKIDADHTQVQFIYTHLGFSHLSARLNQATGRFDFDPAKPANSFIDVQLPMSSLSTGVPRFISAATFKSGFALTNAFQPSNPAPGLAPTASVVFITSNRLNRFGISIGSVKPNNPPQS